MGQAFVELQIAVVTGETGTAVALVGSQRVFTDAIIAKSIHVAFIDIFFAIMSYQKETIKVIRYTSFSHTPLQMYEIFNITNESFITICNMTEAAYVGYSSAVLKKLVINTCRVVRDLS